MPTPRQRRLERQYSYREAFLAALSRRTSSPTDDWPTVRCWQKRSFDRIFKQVRAEIGDGKPSESNIAILNWITRLGLVCTIETDTEDFYLLEIGASLQSAIEPSELMMAFQPSGVICYFSALSFHSLTTQIPTHHHVAVLTHAGQPDPDQKPIHDFTVEVPSTNAIVKPPITPQHMRIKRNPLGHLAFTYAGIPYYKTNRTQRLIPGVQERTSGPRGRFRITNLEQTLLDTLYKPQNCGGAAAVLEAWEEAIASQRLDEDRLVAHLTQMNYPSTTRRLGAMFHHLEYTPGNKLDTYLSRAKERIEKNDPHSQISMLPGVDYTNLDQDWLVRRP